MKLASKFSLTILASLFCLTSVFNQLPAQARVLIAGRVSTIASPEVEFFGRKMGFGPMVKVDWVTKKEKHRFVEVSLDFYKLIDGYERSYFISVPHGYTLNIFKASYGHRSFFQGGTTGMYAEAGLGVLLSDAKGALDDELNKTIGLTGALTPGFGYAGNNLDIGLKSTFAYTDGDVVVMPVVHFGLRL
jgi:hypothetical protein